MKVHRCCVISSVGCVPDTASVDRRKGARAAEWDGLENRCGFVPTVGSNPTPSAIAAAAQTGARIRQETRMLADPGVPVVEPWRGVMETFQVPFARPRALHVTVVARVEHVSVFLALPFVATTE